MNEPPAGPVARARAYYRAIDDDEYDLLAALLTEEFGHERPDRTIEGRERFVRFMRDERPATDTSHLVDGVYVRRGETGESWRREVAVRGRLRGPDGDRLFGFVDVFRFERVGAEWRATRLWTYAD